jgi:glyoxylase-like metal-dependent hydrolase (beta-lactamase superfamily II)
VRAPWGNGGIAAPILQVDEWLLPNFTIDLGGRELKVLYTPGHTDDSISLLDTASATLFTGDFIYPGSFIAFMPNPSLIIRLEMRESLERTALLSGACQNYRWVMCRI